ncbi:MAG: hypothetical protein WC756_19185 [Taibaiella sp.]
MNNYEVPAIMEDELPAIKEELKENGILGNVNAAMQVLVKYTKKMIYLHDLNAVAKCMRLADKIYDKGNAMVKNAVENVFVYSFSGLRTGCDQLEWKLVQAKMPMTLYSLYVKQIYRSGL